MQKIFHAIIAFCMVATLAQSFVANASTTDGTIDATNKYAWGQKIGWINFGNTQGNVHVTDSGLTGYAWSQNYGWINFAPTNAGVHNDSNGNLSGYAWGEKLGYISFSGVVINSSGRFTGSATSSITGTISFDCTNCNVSTDWRPQSARSSGGGSGGSSGGGGGGGGTGYYIPATTPTVVNSALSVIINNGASAVTNARVTLNFIAPADTTFVSISNNASFVNASQVPYQASVSWDLCANQPSCSSGTRIVYVKFLNSHGVFSPIVSASIMVNIQASSNPPVETQAPGPVVSSTNPTHTQPPVSSNPNQITPGPAENTQPFFQLPKPAPGGVSQLLGNVIKSLIEIVAQLNHQIAQPQSSGTHATSSVNVSTQKPKGKVLFTPFLGGLTPLTNKISNSPALQGKYWYLRIIGQLVGFFSW